MPNRDPHMAKSENILGHHLPENILLFENLVALVPSRFPMTPSPRFEHDRVPTFSVYTAQTYNQPRLLCKGRPLQFFSTSYVLAFWIGLVHQLHALLIHGKHDTTTQDQPDQPRQCPTPERQDTLLLKDHARAAERVAVQRARFNALHARLDGVERLRYIDSDQPSNAAHGKRASRSHLLPWGCVPLGQLLEAIVNREASRAVGGLPRSRGHESLEEAPDATLAGDDGDGVEEAA